MLEELESKMILVLGRYVIRPSLEVILEDVQRVRHLWICDADGGSVVIHKELETDILADVLNFDMLAEQLI